MQSQLDLKNIGEAIELDEITGASQRENLTDM
jgi:hypothetical protein